MQLEELAKRQTEKLRNDAQDNRKRFPVGAELKDPVDRIFKTRSKLIRASNAQTGESIGPLDEEPWIPWQDFGIYGDPRQTLPNDRTVRRK